MALQPADYQIAFAWSQSLGHLGLRLGATQLHIDSPALLDVAEPRISVQE